MAYMVYGKSKEMKMYLPIGKYGNNITFVDRLMYAYMYNNEEDAQKVADMFQAENPDVKFEVRNS